MNFSKRTPPPVEKTPTTLAEWLDVATRDLVPSAQARVRAEIEAHYTEAMQSYQLDGKTESEAQDAALADLGNPEKAARHFGQTCLTRRDIPRYLRSLARTQLRTQLGYAIQYLFHGFVILGLGLVGGEGHYFTQSVIAAGCRLVHAGFPGLDLPDAVGRVCLLDGSPGIQPDQFAGQALGPVD